MYAGGWIAEACKACRRGVGLQRPAKHVRGVAAPIPRYSNVLVLGALLVAVHEIDGCGQWWPLVLLVQDMVDLIQFFVCATAANVSLRLSGPFSPPYSL